MTVKNLDLDFPGLTIDFDLAPNHWFGNAEIIKFSNGLMTATCVSNNLEIHI